jgi:hypothetical protein
LARDVGLILDGAFRTKACLPLMQARAAPS